MKIQVNKQILKELSPCEDRWRNYLSHHAEFSGDLVEFLQLKNITPLDKIWVAIRLLPRFEDEVFAIDCAAAAYDAASASAAAAYAAAYDAAYDAASASAASAAAAAAYDASAASAAAAAAAAYNAERERQIEVLIYLAEMIGQL